MRDNHTGMPEIVDAFEAEEQYFGVVGVEIGDVSKTFRFGVSASGYRALKRVLQLRPLDLMPGIKQRYFFAGGFWSLEDSSDCGMHVRVEQGRDGKQVAEKAPRDLLANLRWFAELKDFSEAAHLPEAK